MADGTKIEWSEATWNPITGCSFASPGCTNCYAMELAGTRLADHPSRKGLTQPSKAGPVWTGELRFNEQWLDQPLRWKRPRMIFVCAHGDLFHESVPDEWIDKVFAVMALARQHTFQVLTKRSGRMRDFFRETTGWRARIAELLNELKPSPLWNGNVYQGWQNLHGRPDGLPNVWLGVSVEDQQRADERIPDLLATPAAIRWISAEPLLGPVDLTRIIEAGRAECYYKQGAGFTTLNGKTWTDSRGNLNSLTGHFWGEDLLDGAWEPWTGKDEPSPGFGQPGYYRPINWVVAGGESGAKARPMHPDWARALRDQCAAAGVPFFFKQWGEFAPGEIAGAFLDPEKPALGFTLFDNRWSECWSEVDGHCDDEPDVYRVGKKRAGRLLDGAEHNAMPRA